MSSGVAYGEPGRPQNSALHDQMAFHRGKQGWEHEGVPLKPGKGTEFAGILAVDETRTSVNSSEFSSFIESTTFITETWYQIKIIVPLIVSNITEIIPQLIAMSIVGNLPDDSADKLSAVAMGRSFANVTGLAIAWGMTSGLYTLIPQSIGAQAWGKLTLSTQRAFVVSHVVLMPLIILQWFLGDILVAIGLPSKMCEMVGLYCKLYIPNMIFVVWLTILQRLAQGFDYNKAQVAAGLISDVFMYGVCYVLVIHTDLDYLGCAIALDLTMFLNAILMAAYLCWEGHSYLFVPRQWCEIRQGLREYWSLSWPGVFSSSAEWICVEVITICGGYMNNPSVSVAVIGTLNNLLCLVIVQTFSISTAVQVRVGKFTGAGMVYHAKQCSWVGLMIQLVDSLVIWILLIWYRTEILTVFSNDSDVIRIGESAMYALSVSCVAGGLEQFIFAIFKGLGYPKECSVSMSVAYYLIVIPLYMIVMFALEVRKSTLWGSIVSFASIALAQSLSSVFLTLLLLFKIDWKYAAHSAILRSQESLKNTTKYGSIHHSTRNSQTWQSNDVVSDLI